MSGEMLRATPFHARTAEANRGNAWITRNGVTLAESYESVECEALGARLNVAIADISWRWRIVLEGTESGRFLAHFLTRDANALAPGEALKALWLSDAGGVRGAGVVARYGQYTFGLAASAPDAEWIAGAAESFGVTVHDASEDTGGLALIGPYAHETLKAAGVADDLEPLTFRKFSWRGIEVTLSRWGEHGGYEMWCEPDDGLLVWDRLMRAGRAFGIVAAGTAAIDILDLEAGVARPNLDYRPTRDAHDAEPLPAELGLQRLVDETHASFNGRRAHLASRPQRQLVGLEIDAAEPAPFTPVMLNGKAIGHTLRSVYSPALRRAIALAQIETAAAKLGSVVSLDLPPTMSTPVARNAKAHILALPFLPAPVPFGS